MKPCTFCTDIVDALREHIAAVQALTSLKNNPALIERSPTQDKACFDAWVRLNEATKAANELIARAQQEGK